MEIKLLLLYLLLFLFATLATSLISAIGLSVNEASIKGEIGVTYFLKALGGCFILFSFIYGFAGFLKIMF